MLKRIAITCLLMVTCVIWFSSCNKNNNNTLASSNFSATLNGAAETPPNASVATGTATFTYNPNTKQLAGTVTYAGIDAVAAHIHSGAVGVAGPVVFPLSEAPITSPISFTATLAAAEETDLMANLYYVNIHSAAFPGGEIRGQLIKQ